MDRGDDDKNYMKKKGTKHVIHYNLNPSNQLLFEDTLKKCLNKFGGAGIKLRHKCAPRNKHSPFGDFPPEYMTQRSNNFDLINIDCHQVAHDGIDLIQKPKTSHSKIQAFTSLRKETIDKPPRAGAVNPRKITVSDFRLHYDRGDLPILVQHERGTTIKWKDPTFEKFNYQLYLPIFVDGIREKTDPYRFLSIQGTFDLLEHVKDNVVKVIPQLILPLKAALNTRDVDIIAVALKVFLVFSSRKFFNMQLKFIN